MMIELHHQQHGIKHAYSEAEAQADEKQGWLRAGGNPAVADDTREVLAEAYRQKHGKAPHHKMKLETIKAAL